MLGPVLIAFISFALVFGAALFGVFLRGLLPEDQLSADSKKVIDGSIGVIATLAAIVLGLLVASAKGSYDDIHNRLKQISAAVITLDHSMANYGSETKEARELLRRTIGSAIEEIRPDSNAETPTMNAAKHIAGFEQVQELVRNLRPANDAQRSLQTRALQVSGEISQGSWLIIELAQTHITTLFLIVLVLWLMLVFFGFGLFAPRNGTVIGALLFGALSVSAAILLILELYDPLNGLIRIPTRPLEIALEYLSP